MFDKFILRLSIFTLFLIAASVPTRQTLADDTLAARKNGYKGEVIFIRGGFDVFSKGLDEMAAKLVKRGFTAQVLQHTQTRSITAKIISNQTRYGRKPVVLIGHSWGANAAITIARSLKQKGIRVDYLASVAATNPSPVPSNVRKATSYYFQKDGWGKPVRRDTGTRGIVKNIDMSKTPGVNHFNIDQNPRIQRQVIQNVLRFIGRKRRT